MHFVSLQPHREYPPRAPVRHVDWTLPDPDYAPVDFTHPKVLTGMHADPVEFTPSLLEDRVSHALGANGPVPTDPETGRPRNPMGRTGMVGRGVLPRYGANFVHNPLVVTCFKGGVLKVLTVQRANLHYLVIPHLDELAYPEGVLGLNTVFRGYVDDARNTDEAWVEVVCTHTHVPDGFKLLRLKAGVESRWTDVSKNEHDFSTMSTAHKGLIVEAMKLNPNKFRAALTMV